MLSRTIGNGIGLASEYAAQRKRSKSQPKSPSPNPESTQPTSADDAAAAEHTGESDDEEAWALDAAQEDEEPQAAKLDIQKAKTVKQLLDAFATLHPPPTPPRATANLPMPVVLPQRRPKHRDRGFVRAYAPVLADQGIDQALFFDFLDGFEKAIRLHPVFHAVNLAVLAGVHAIDLVAGISLSVHAAAFVLHTSIEASRRAVIVHETNRYLDGVNDVLFKPRGLYAMIMTFKPDSPDALEDAKLDNAARSDGVAAGVNKRNDGAGHRLGMSSGKTRGELAIPETAPLVFPTFDAMSEAKQEGGLKKAGHVLEDYNDRRARARFDTAHPDSKLSVPGTEFASRYGDPNSPAVNGGVVGLVTGGRRPGIRYRLKQRRGHGGEPQPRGAKKLLQQNVYYLMIVNMPSEAELKEAMRLQGLAKG